MTNRLLFVNLVRCFGVVYRPGLRFSVSIFLPQDKPTRTHQAFLSHAHGIELQTSTAHDGWSNCSYKLYALSPF